MPLDIDGTQRAATLAGIELRLSVAYLRGIRLDVRPNLEVPGAGNKVGVIFRGMLRSYPNVRAALAAIPAYESDLGTCREIMDELDANGVRWELRGPGWDCNRPFTRAAVARWGVDDQRTVGLDPNPAAAISRAYLVAVWSLRARGLWIYYDAPTPLAAHAEELDEMLATRFRYPDEK